MSAKLRLAINGYGRIGRCFLRALYESPARKHFEIVAINEPADLDSMTYLTRFDSTHGVFPGQVDQGDQTLIINGHEIKVTHADTPEGVNWRSYDLDVLIECSGRYSQRNQLMRFIAAGCPRLLLSHPADGAAEVDRTVVFGINEHALMANDILVSNASCTTNAIVPVLAALNQAFELDSAFLTTLHSVMNDQPLIDGYHRSDLRRTRSAMQSIVPVSTGLAKGVERLLPELAGKVVAKAIRVPTLNVSAIDLMVTTGRPVSVETVNEQMQILADNAAHLVACSSHPHASIDFNHNPHSAIIDASQTRVNGQNFVNLLVWFDNEWGFANRLLDTLGHWATQLSTHRLARHKQPA
ncbi:MAG: erythrose-4-phosphate dehydrogenase [Pusillimonas sp.]|jgi:glyceraldehyde-3-phosphate dehydrogenase type I|nr:erythrose-4-phosphate dehydrogenase [Pusillimonas sp.]